MDLPTRRRGDGPAVRSATHVGTPAPAQRLPVGNFGSGPLCLFLEPLGSDYWLRPGETFIVVGTGGEGQFQVDSVPGEVSVHVLKGDVREVKVVDSATGWVLPPGHGRTTV
ncbi:hypothetical protein AB0F81_14335 [Actinoplanes sp. NPDC024001]|uniref:hypothetical protein n=1 Tax=Actinoplanes sp. NPDC024001 TaxID=3154598 RepID=UPI003402D91B